MANPEDRLSCDVAHSMVEFGEKQINNSNVFTLDGLTQLLVYCHAKMPV